MRIPFRTQALILIGALAAAGADYYPPADQAGGWRTAAPEEQGMDARQLDEVFSYIQGSSKNGGLLVARRGWLVYERYFGLADRESTPNTASCGKSFTSIAMGILMRERPELFPGGLDQKVYSPKYLPEAAFPLGDPGRADIKLGQLLAMTGGIRGNNPSYVRGQTVTLEPPGPDGWEATQDEMAAGKLEGPRNTLTLWCKPGEGYSYATSSIHLVSMIIRHVSGMELEEFVRRRLAGPLGWGRWGWGYRQTPLKHTPGGGGIAPRATDMLRFAYLLLRGGLWNGVQLVPEDYVRACGRVSPYNPHYPYSLQFTVNGDGHVKGAPRDAFWKAGSGGHSFYVAPSLDLVVWKLGGRDEQYSPANTGLPVIGPAKTPRADWKAAADADAATARTLEMVVAAVLR